MVDIRYVLFIIDKFGGADHLVKEMKLAGLKTKKELLTGGYKSGRKAREPDKFSNPVF